MSRFTTSSLRGNGIIRCATCCFARISSVLSSVAVYRQRRTDRRRLTMDVERSVDVALEQQAAVGRVRVAEALLHLLPRRRHRAWIAGKS
jgi:hypothetical protein